MPRFPCGTIRHCSVLFEQGPSSFGHGDGVCVDGNRPFFATSHLAPIELPEHVLTTIVLLLRDSTSADAEARSLYSGLMGGIGSVCRSWRRLVKGVLMGDELAWLRVQGAAEAAECLSSFPHAKSLRIVGDAAAGEIVSALRSGSVARLAITKNNVVRGCKGLGQLVGLRALYITECRNLAPSLGRMTHASSFRDSVPATLPQLLGSHCLHASPPLGSPLANPQPPATAPHTSASAQHATSSMHRRRAQAPAHSTSPADACSLLSRFSDFSSASRKRLGASDAAPSSPIGLTARTAAPRLAPRRTRTTRYSPAHIRLSSQHATSSMHRRRAQTPAHSIAGCPSCSDPIDCTHRRSSARPSPTPNHPLQPRAQLPQPITRNSMNTLPALESTRSQRSWPPMHAAYG